MMGIECAGELDRAHYVLAQHGPQAPVFALEETVVKAHVVRSQYRTVEVIVEDRGDVLEGGRSLNNVNGNSGEAGDKGGNAYARVDQRLPAFCLHPTLEADEGNLGGTIIRGGGACRFHVEQGNWV
jgi:hypothetical protein